MKTGHGSQSRTNIRATLFCWPGVDQSDLVCRIMNDLLSFVGTSSEFGLNWPAWIATGGFTLFCLLWLYATLLLIAGERLPARLRFIRFSSLRNRMVLGFVLAGTLPAISLVFALLDEKTVALVWLVGTLIITVCLALAIVNSISGPLEALDKSIRDFQLNDDQARSSPHANTPREVLVIFEHLRSLQKRLGGNYRKLRKAVKQGEKLRSELIYVISNREKEIEQRTEELKQANETLQRLCREDSLTGLANRRSFAQFLTRTWQGSMRNHQPISILIIDIDDFKAYNDHYGHKKGDSCLKLISEAIRRTVGRASDLVSRYGGEEFVVVLGDTSLEGGLKIAENIRAAIENLGIPHKGSKKHRMVTVSIGVTSTLPAPEIQPATVLVAADRAMYIAKHDGKNQVAYSTAAGTGIYQALCMPANPESRLS